MDRAERAGLGVAVAGHVLLFGALSLGLVAIQTPPPPVSVPVDVSIVDEVGARDSTPQPAPSPPAPSPAREVAPPQDAAPEPAPPIARSEPIPAPPRAERAPAPKPVPVKVAPKPVTPKPAAAKPAPSKPAPSKPVPSKLAATSATAARPARRPGLDRSLIAGLSDAPRTAATRPAPATAASGPRAPSGPEMASIARAIREQIKPHWKAPTGADAEQLRTELSLRLARDGSLLDAHVVRTTGQTDSNRGQVRLHQEAALKAVRLAAPFTLPPELYDAWKAIEPLGFDKRLSQ